MSRLTNTRIASTATGQKSETSFELTKERIHSAFAGLSEATQFNGNDNESKNFIGSLNDRATPRGVRWSAPISANRLIGFVTERRWQGNILSVDAKGKFWARVFDVAEEGADEIEEAQFELEDVPDLTKHLVKPGAIFYWDIGFQVEPSGQRLRQSVLSFPMIPTITKSDRLAARKRAEERFSSLGWDSQHGQSVKSEDAASSR